MALVWVILAQEAQRLTARRGSEVSHVMMRVQSFGVQCLSGICVHEPDDSCLTSLTEIKFGGHGAIDGTIRLDGLFKSLSRFLLVLKP